MNLFEYTNHICQGLNDINQESLDSSINIIYNAIIKGKKIFIIGNGGSAASASHLAVDLSRTSFNSQNQQIKAFALSLTDNVAFLTASANDYDYTDIFVEQLKTYSSQGDVLIAISCSGKSNNIIKALKYANENSIITICFTGFNGGDVLQYSNNYIHIPINDFGIVESIHSTIFHYIPNALIKKHQNIK